MRHNENKPENEMSATDKIKKLLEVIANGKTLYITTYTKSTKITAKTVSKFAALGIPVLKAKNNSMYMASGKNFVCIDYCKFTYATN